MASQDYLHECLADPALADAVKRGPQVFRDKVCGVCRNFECVRSNPLNPEKNPWLERILTQEERLLLNPSFADVRDPRFAQVRQVDFRSALQEAISIEVATAKGDWSVPTEADKQAYLAKIVAAGGTVPNLDPKPPARLIDEVRVIPDGPGARTALPPPDLDPDLDPSGLEVEVKIERSKTGRASCRYCREHLVIGQPRFGRFAFDPMVGKPVWQWFHVPCAEQEFPEEVVRARSGKPAAAPVMPAPPPQAPAPAPTPPPQAPALVPASRTPQAPVGPAARTFTPPAGNTPAPRGGVTLGSPAPAAPQAPQAPAHDPWSAPAPGVKSARTVSVGATIRMGGDDPKGDK